MLHIREVDLLPVGNLFGSPPSWESVMNNTTETMTMREVDRSMSSRRRLRPVASQVRLRRLGLTTRQVRRLVARLRDHGPIGLVSGRCLKPSNNRLDTAGYFSHSRALRRFRSDASAR